MTDEDIDFTDLPEVTDEMWENGVLRKGVDSPSNDLQESLSIDRDIIEFFKAQGQNYQVKINELLRDYMKANRVK